MKRSTAEKNYTEISHIFLDSYQKLVMYHALVSYINSSSRSVCGKIFILPSLSPLSDAKLPFKLPALKSQYIFLILTHITLHTQGPHPILYSCNSIIFCLFLIFYLKMSYILIPHIKCAFPCFKLLYST